jgi:broad specificity phosphatase PhoE
MRRIFLLVCALLPLRAEIVDRIAITAGQQVITELQLDEEIRVTALLNQQPIDRSMSARRAAAARLIQQLLIKSEMDVSHYPAPAAADVNRFVEQVRTEIAGRGDFDETLRRYNLSESVLREHVAMQLTTLQFIEFRFRPELGVSPADIESYYQGELARWKAGHAGARPPTLAESSEGIRRKLAERRTDQALDAWLAESRKQVAIVYLDKGLE